MRIDNIESEPLAELYYWCAPSAGQSPVRALPILRGKISGLPEELDGLIVASDLQGLDTGRTRLVGEVLVDELLLLSADGKIPPVERLGVILAGDLYCRSGADRKGGAGDVTSVWKAFAGAFLWATGVPGNHDLFDGGATRKDLENANRESGAQVLHDEAITLTGITIAGFGGVVGTNARPWRTPPADFTAAIRRLLGKKPEILVLHEPPERPGIARSGNDDIRATLEDARTSALVICGHCHWEEPLARIGPAGQVLNVDSRCVVLTR